MLELPNFGRMTTSTIQPLFQNTFILRRPRADNFADIIKIATILIKTTFQESKKVKRMKN